MLESIASQFSERLDAFKYSFEALSPQFEASFLKDLFAVTPYVEPNIKVFDNLSLKVRD